MNLIEKMRALMVSSEVNIWHFWAKKNPPRFYYWIVSETENRDGYGFESLEEMINAAYAIIDPLERPLPDSITCPTQADSVT